MVLVRNLLEEHSRPILSIVVALLVLILRRWSLTVKPFPRSEAEREQLRAQVVEAARRRSAAPIRDQEVQIRQRRQRPKKDPAKVETVEAPKAPRQATPAEELRYREEKLSQQQFGFSIYGNTDYCFDCVPTAVTSSHASGFGLGIHSIGVIAGLPGSSQVYKELERLRDEFDPIVKARGWKVLNLTEMCCCGDGDEALQGRTSDPTRQEQGNILGYCNSPNDNRIAQGIHIRCRVLHSCRDGLRLYPYAELVQTMCHELAHIAVGSHNDRFYRLMKELEDEYQQRKMQHPWGSGYRLGQ